MTPCPLLLVLSLFGACGCPHDRNGGNGQRSDAIVAVNEDNDHYFCTHDESEMTVSALEAYVDRMATGKVTHFFMCPSGQRTSYDSKIWEPIWTALDEPGGANLRWGVRAKLLRDRGIDPYAVWIRRCRQRGISPWLSPRMNDAHNATQEWPLRNTTFWRTRTDLHCATNAFGRGVFNFANQEVRDYTFALVKELLDRYDVDGLELDFMRFDRYFPERDATNCTHFLDAFVKRVKAAVDVKARECGRRIQLGVRVPTTPRGALALGMDVGKWAREGWVNMVCASTAWRTPDYNLPVAAWRQAFGPASARVKLLAGTDHGVTNWNWNRTDMTPELYAGFADVEWGNGVDGIYLFNAIYLKDAFETVCRKGLFPGDLVAYTRRYPVSFRAESYGVVSDDRQLPRLSDRRNTFKVRLGKHPVGAVSVLVGVQEKGPFSPPVSLNGVKASSSRVERPEFGNYDHPDRTYDYSFRRYFFPAGSVHPGADNLVEIEPSETRMTVTWVEIDLDMVSECN